MYLSEMLRGTISLSGEHKSDLATLPRDSLCGNGEKESHLDSIRKVCHPRLNCLASWEVSLIREQDWKSCLCHTHLFFQ